MRIWLESAVVRQDEGKSSYDGDCRRSVHVARRGMRQCCWQRLPSVDATGYQDVHRSIPLFEAFGAGDHWDEPGPGELTKVGFAANDHTDNAAVVTI